MPFFKKKLTEQEAAAAFVSNIIQAAQAAWPQIYDDLKDAFGEKFVVEDEAMADFDLFLAAIAQDLQVVRNLFPNDQAERINKWVYQFLNVGDWGEYAVQEVNKYGEQFEIHKQNIDAGGDPTSAIPARLAQRWLGQNIQYFDVEINQQKTGIISPLLLMSVGIVLTDFLGTWKRIKDNYKLIEGDLPLDWEN